MKLFLYKALVIFRGLAIFVFSALMAVPSPAAEPRPRNVILMIGDGMGALHVQLASDYVGRPLVWHSLPVRGALQTASASHAVTDSAAAGTAMACGRKTNNGMLGRLPDGTPLPSIAELFRDAGRRVGILSSVPINHATPAAFYAKAGARGDYYEIGLMAIASRFDVLGGSTFSDASGRNNPQRPIESLWEKAAAAGYAIIRTPDELRAVGLGKRVIIAPNNLHVGVRIPAAPPFDPARDISLAQMTAKALELLENPAGFFLMVEGGAIDWASHANDTVGVIAETLAFDDAVAVVKAYAESHPDTLLIVTADHETGGLRFRAGYTAERARELLNRQTLSREALIKWLSDDAEKAHGGPDAAWLAAREKIAKGLGLPDEERLLTLEKDFRKLLTADAGQRADVAAVLVRVASAVRDELAGIQWTTGHHTADDVPLFASGPGAERFAGTQDNTRIFEHIQALLQAAAP